MSTSTQQPEEPTGGPKTTLTVPAKPAAITGANLLTLAGTAAVAGGPVGWLAAGAVVGAPVAAVAARRVYRNRAERKERTRRERTEKTSTSGSSSRGKGLFGKSPRPGGGSGSGTGNRPGRGGSGRPGGRHAAGSPGSGRNPLGRPLPGGKSKGGPAGSGSGGPGKGRGGRDGGQPSGKKGFLPKWLRGKGNGPGGGSGKTGKPGGKSKKPNVPHTIGPCGGPGPKKTKKAPGGQRSGSTKPNGPGQVRPGKPVKPTVSRPAGKPASAGPGAVRPGAPVRSPWRPTPSNAGSSTGGSDMSAGTRDAAGRMWANTTAWEPKGMLDAVEEFHDLPQTISYVRGTVGALMEKSAARLPLDPAIAKAIGQVVQLLDTAAKMSVKIPEAVETIHKQELDRLRRPRAGEVKWDRSANGLA